MKKYLSIIICLAMLCAAASCSSTSFESSESTSVVEDTTEETTTEVTTEATTETKTEPTTEKIKLEKEYTFDDISFMLPEIANKQGTLPYGDDQSVTMISLRDTSEIQLIISQNTTGVSFDSEDEDTLYSFLELCASAFSSSSSWKNKSDIKKTKIKNIAAISQDLESSEYEVKMYFFVYNDKIYSLGFYVENGKEDTLAFVIADDVIDSLKFAEIKQETTEQPTTEKVTEPQTTAPVVSSGQSDVLKNAKHYIDLMPFSHDGLVGQLEFEGYSHDDAVYAADNCGADWNKQAVDQAKSYIDLMGFSYTGLVDQLEHEKYTHDQAVYGADNCGADWNAEAAESAESYVSMMSMSRGDLISQLLYEGYTQSQAEYGADSVGY